MVTVVIINQFKM